LSISLAGVSFVGNGFAENAHSFDSKFGTSGIFTPGSFLSPQHLAFDSENNLYVTDLGNARVQKFDSNGNFLSEWGSKGTEPGKFGHPSGIAISGEFVFVVDNRNHNVQKFDLNGNFITEWGSFGINNGSFKSPRGITISDDQSVFVVDSGNARIQKFTFDGEYITHFGQSGKRGGELITPVDIAINSDKIFVTDSVQNRINIFDLNGIFLRTIDNTVGGFPIYPEGIIFDEQNNFYISDYRNNRIIQYNESGNYLSIFGQMGTGDGQFKFPKDLAISEDGYLFVTDTQGHRIQKFTTPVSIEYSSMIKEELEAVTPQVEPETQPLIIIPNDFKKPTILVPGDVLVEASGLLTFVNIGDAMATDENGILSLSHNAPSSFPLGVNTIIWTAIDGAGNMAIASQIVTIQDTIAPKISPLDEISLEAKSSSQNTVFLDVPLVTDDVGVYSITNDAPEVFPLGETIVTWTATDVIGNTSTLTQSVNLIDSISPRIAILDDITIEASNLNENLVELIIPESFDQVEIASITNDAPEVFPLGETIVTWTATDTSGNSASITQTISVIDTTAPVIDQPEDIVIDAVNTTNLVDVGLAYVEDIIDDSPMITNDAPEVFPLGETIVTWTATDKFGNSSFSSQIISVQACGNSPSYYNTIVGSEDDDLLIGTTLPDLIFAKGGDDIISGSKGNDCILGGEGNDIIFGNEGNDNISGQSGNDIIKGHSGDDYVSGGLGFDIIDGGDDLDTCRIIDEQNSDLVVKCESNSTEN